MAELPDRLSTLKNLPSTGGIMGVILGEDEFKYFESIGAFVNAFFIFFLFFSVSYSERNSEIKIIYLYLKNC